MKLACLSQIQYQNFVHFVEKKRTRRFLIVNRAVNRPLSIGPTHQFPINCIPFQNKSPGLAVIMDGLRAVGPGSNPVMVDFFFFSFCQNNLYGFVKHQTKFSAVKTFSFTLSRKYI